LKNGNIDITYYKPTDLIAAEYNPRQLTKDQHKDLTDSIKRFGLVDPLIVNTHKERKNVLIGGHQRLKIATMLGLKEIPCVEVELNPAKEKELNIRLNKNVGEWDWDALANYFDVGELTEWGFTDDELQFYEDEPTEGLIDDDEVPEVEEAITQAGDLWLLGEHRVLCGDSTKEGDVEALMGQEKADMVFTDPPYGVEYEGGSKKWKKLEGDTEGFEIYYDAVAKSKRYIKDEGSLYICFASMKSEQVFKALREGGLNLKNMIIWSKNNAQFGMLGANYHQKHEPIIFACNGKRYNWYGAKNEVTVWDIARAHKNEYHSTQKPVELVVRAISNSSKPKYLIMDLFCGGGSTLIACEKTNRKCYGMEIDPHYCDVIVKRWEEYTGNKAERIEAASA
jgi:DNA modification methylase